MRVAYLAVPSNDGQCRLCSGDVVRSQSLSWGSDGEKSSLYPLCILCVFHRQTSHNCSRMAGKVDTLNDLQNKGLIPSRTTWLCNECLKENDLHLQPSMVQKKLIEQSTVLVQITPLLPIGMVKRRSWQRQTRAQGRRGQQYKLDLKRIQVAHRSTMYWSSATLP